MERGSDGRRRQKRGKEMGGEGCYRDRKGGKVTVQTIPC